MTTTIILFLIFVIGLYLVWLHTRLDEAERKLDALSEYIVMLDARLTQDQHRLAQRIGNVAARHMDELRSIRQEICTMDEKEKIR